MQIALLYLQLLGGELEEEHPVYRHEIIVNKMLVNVRERIKKDICVILWPLDVTNCFYQVVLLVISSEFLQAFIAPQQFTTF